MNAEYPSEKVTLQRVHFGSLSSATTLSVTCDTAWPAAHVRLEWDAVRNGSHTNNVTNVANDGREHNGIALNGVLVGIKRGATRGGLTHGGGIIARVVWSRNPFEFHD